MGRAVDRLLRGLGLATDVARVGAIEVWPAVVTGAFGPDAAATRAVGIEGETLVVAVPTPAWASEIRLREHEIVSALQRASPASGIRRIRTVPTRSRT